MKEFAFGTEPPGSGRICVVGAGFMGCVIATLYAHHGYDAVICDSNQTMLDTYVERARPIAAGLVEDSDASEAMLAGVTLEPDLASAVEGAFLVHEAVQESLEVKQALFAELERICPENVVLATNTSSFLISDIAAQMTRKERMMGIHYVTPGHIVPVIELIHAADTPAELVAWSRMLVQNIEHVGVAILERPGFLVNRIQFAMLTEIYRLMDEGLVSRSP